MEIKKFTVNSYKENLYVLYDETKECVIIDCGCQTIAERFMVIDFIENHGLRPQRLLCTHYHLDHVMGNAFVSSRYGIAPEVNVGDKRLVRILGYQAMALGIDVKIDETLIPAFSLDDGVEIRFGMSRLKVIHTPGHSPGGVSFYSRAEKILISGDTLMKHSCGATNLPGGKAEALEASMERLFMLPSDVIVYPGHGDTTTIGAERAFHAAERYKSNMQEADLKAVNQD